MPVRTTIKKGKAVQNEIILDTDPRENDLLLYRAVIRGDWEQAKKILNEDKDAWTTKLNIYGETALHIAIDSHKNIKFVENLLKEINPESLPDLVTDFHYNALHYAAMVDNVEAAKLLVEKNPHLLFFIVDRSLPIHIAISNSHIITFKYLFDACMEHIELSIQYGHEDPFKGELGAKLLCCVIEVGLVDVAYELINKCPHIATIKTEDYVPLKSIAESGHLYYSGTQYNFYQKFVYSYVPTVYNYLGDTAKTHDIEKQDTYNYNIITGFWKSCFYYAIGKIYAKLWNVALLYVSHVKHLHEDKVKHYIALILMKSICKELYIIDKGADIKEHYGEAFKLAEQNDTPEAVEEILEFFPQAISRATIAGYYPTNVAITDRCEKVHNFLVRYMTRHQYLINTCMDEDQNNILHLAAKKAPTAKLNLVSGAALQMQKELKWFKGVEKFGKPKYKESKNKNGDTPMMLFRDEHKDLRKEGEEWMKKTADSYTITAVLIITIVFAAAITVPGGNEDHGKPNFEKRSCFIIFAISDVISLFASTTSLLLFLSILTARYRDEDFVYGLPLRLILGLVLLFLSVTSMMVAFSATVYLMFGHGKAWIMIPIATLTCLPITSFVTLQLPLLVDLISSTFGQRNFVEHEL